MSKAEKLDKVLDDLGIAYKHAELEDDVEHYELTLDEEDDLVGSLVIFGTEEERMVRIFIAVDDLAASDSIEQLSLLMALNGEISTGAFCMDPEEHVIYSTVAFPHSGCDTDMLRMLIEALVFARELYLDEFYPMNGEMPEG